jgi:hypothetical protein
MGRQLRELRRALLPIAPQVADPRPGIPAPVSVPQPEPLQEKIQQRKNALRGKTT